MDSNFHVIYIEDEDFCDEIEAIVLEIDNLVSSLNIESISRLYLELRKELFPNDLLKNFISSLKKYDVNKRKAAALIVRISGVVSRIENKYYLRMERKREVSYANILFLRGIIVEDTFMYFMRKKLLNFTFTVKDLYDYYSYILKKEKNEPEIYSILKQIFNVVDPSLKYYIK